MAATTKKLYVWVNGYGNNGGDDGKYLPCINVEFNFRVEQTYQSRTRGLITRHGIGEISSRRPYKYFTYDLLYTMIHGMKIPFPLEKMLCEPTELENTNDLILHVLDVASCTVNRFCNSGQKLFRLDIYIVNRLILPHAEFEAINLAKEQVERWFQLHQKVNQMILSKSFSDFGLIHGEIGRIVRETAHDQDLELSLLELAMREYFQETVEPVRFEGDIDDHGEEEEEVLCVICKDEILVGSRVIRMACSRIYHVQCIAEWLPLCRFKSSINKSELQNRKKRFWNLLYIALLGMLIARMDDLGCTVIMFMASYENYPSGYALKDLHRMGYATNNSNEQWVHIDSFSAMNGISLFCENDFPWRYSKEEDMHLDEFCQRNFTYLLHEYPKMNGFKCLFTINEFSRARFHNGFPPILLLREPKVFVHGNIANTDVMHRRYVAVLGNPNVGKSTLSNQMIGQKLSIVTDKPQTMRHRILGICSGPEYQMILYDTPGVIEKKLHKLDSMMMNNVRSAAINADCVLVVVDACKDPQKIDEVLEEGAGNLKDKVPKLLVLNKRDLIKPGEMAKKLEWYEKFTVVDEVIPVSAKYGHGVDDVKDWILSKLPVGPAYYPKDIASEHPERFFVAEIIREKIFMQYRDEVPYACQVNVVNYKTRPTAIDFIQVEIIVEKNSQKIILIGKDGKGLKLLATAARLDIEDFLQKKVFLEVEVKVKENWRQDEGLLKHYGYGGPIRAL